MSTQETLNKFDEIYYESYNTIVKYVICNCYNIEDVKDIVQNIYLDLYKTLLKNSSINDINSYLFRITKNKINDYYRFKYKTKFISMFTRDDKNIIDEIPSNINIEKNIIIKENIDEIWNFLKTKKVIVSKIFYLYYYQDMSIKEISYEFNISESNVKHYLYRTLKELNVYLSGGENE